MINREQIRMPPHRPWFKVAINAILRFFQTRRRPARLLVMLSRFDTSGRLVGYGLGRILHFAKPSCGFCGRAGADEDHEGCTGSTESIDYSDIRRQIENIRPAARLTEDA